MRVIAIVFLFLALAGCSVAFDVQPTEGIRKQQSVSEVVDDYMYQRDIDDTERRALILSAAGKLLDIYGTLFNGDQCVEQNPLLGESPADWQVIAIPLAELSFEFWMYSDPEYDSREFLWYSYTSGAMHAYYGITNYLDCPP